MRDECLLIDLELFYKAARLKINKTCYVKKNKGTLSLKVIP